MKLYEIDKAIENILEYNVNEVSGEINAEALNELDSLIITKSNKILDIGCYIKSLQVQIAAHKAEETLQRKKRHTLKNKKKWLIQYLSQSIGRSESYTDPRCQIKWSNKGTEKFILDVPIEHLPDEWIQSTPKISIMKKELKISKMKYDWYGHLEETPITLKIK